MTYAERARLLIGCRFRPQGRDENSGLDCLGLAATTYGIPLQQVPTDYRLRGNHFDALFQGMTGYFRQIRVGQVKAGDLLLCAAAADQPHMLVKTDAGFIHADAGLRRIVETPGAPPWPVRGVFRRRRTIEE